MGKMIRLTLLFNILTVWCVSIYILVNAFVNKSLDLRRENVVDTQDV